MRQYSISNRRQEAQKVLFSKPARHHELTYNESVSGAASQGGMVLEAVLLKEKC